MVSVTEQFLKDSSLHGLRYLGRPRPARQRVFWTCLLTLGAAVMVYYIMQCWSFTYEVLVMVENPHQELEDVPFPAVTVCPAIKALKSKVHWIGEIFVDRANFTQFENAVIAMSLLKYPFYHLAQDFFESVHGDVAHLEDEDVLNVMNMVKADLESVVEDCHWQAQPRPCRHLFRQQMTHEGYCFSFNSKAAYRSQTELGHSPPVDGSDGRLRALRSRSRGLDFRLRPLVGERLDGDPQPDLYSVAVHDGALLPDMALAIAVLPDRPRLLAAVGVSVSIVEADDTVVYLPESARGCSTHQGDGGEEDGISCMQKCRDSEVLRRCGCLPFLRIRADPDSRHVPVICGFKHLSCLRDVSPFLRTGQETLGKPGFPPWSGQNQSIACACSPPCSFITYNADFTEVPQSPGEEDGGTRVRVDYTGSGMKYARSARMNARDVLVGSGSMASFLLGFSAVAVFDALVFACKLVISPRPRPRPPHDTASRSASRLGPDKVVMFGSDMFYVHEYKDHADIPIYPYTN